MVDRMQVVARAREGHFLRAQAPTVFGPAVLQQHVEPRLCQVRTEHQSMVPRADDDAVALRRCTLRIFASIPTMIIPFAPCSIRWQGNGIT